MAIDIGPAAIDRGNVGTYGYTYILIDNPANAAGKITSIELWAYENLTGCKVGIFYQTNGGTFKCRSAATIGNVTAGSKQTFSGLSLSVEIGDYIGWYSESGYLEADYSGFAGIYYVGNDHCIVDDEASYGFWDASAMSCHGTGEEPAAAGLSQGHIIG
jgi:hypothetical protein